MDVMEIIFIVLLVYKMELMLISYMNEKTDETLQICKIKVLKLAF